MGDLAFPDSVGTVAYLFSIHVQDAQVTTGGDNHLSYIHPLGIRYAKFEDMRAKFSKFVMDKA